MILIVVNLSRPFLVAWECGRGRWKDPARRHNIACERGPFGERAHRRVLGPAQDSAGGPCRVEDPATQAQASALAN